MIEKSEIECPKCGRGIGRYTQNPSPSSGMSGLSCSPCRIHFDIKISRDGSYQVKNIR